MMNAIELKEMDQELVAGGKEYYRVTNWDLKKLGLDGYIRCTGGWFGSYYDTNRGDAGWKNVGSEDMLKYAERTLGANDPRYQALCEAANCGHAVYDGRVI